MKKIRNVAGYLFIVFLLSGCASVSGGKGLESRVSVLESRVASMERGQTDEGNTLVSLDSSMGQVVKKATVKGLDWKNEDIQTALKNAGYYEGPIDGKLGQGTRKAVKAFQEANGLNVDGIIGSQTKEKLSAYLNKSE